MGWRVDWERGVACEVGRTQQPRGKHSRFQDWAQSHPAVERQGSALAWALGLSPGAAAVKGLVTA